MNIQPTYVTFEQAKLLKLKDFNVPCRQLYVAGKYRINYEKEGDLFNNLMPSLQIPNDWFLAPEQWQVVEFLRINHGIWVYSYSVSPFLADDEDYPKIVWISKVQKFKEFDKFIDTDNGLAVNHFSSPQEAYSAAFDYALKELI
jgi:hypothetical protein